MTVKSELADDNIAEAFYSAYKPFRNNIRRLALEESLEAIWRYSVHLSGELRLPRLIHGYDSDGTPFDIGKYVYPWDLALLAREVLLNAPRVGKNSMLRRSVLAPIINDLRDLSSFRPATGDFSQLLLHMHRLAHQQFPVQRGVQLADLMRYKLIFEHPAMKEVFERGIGLSPKAFYFLGFSVAGAVKSKPKFVTSADYTSFGISDEHRDVFFRRMVGSLPLVIDRIKQSQRFGRSWAFTPNPLQSTPLVNLDPAFPERTLCPIPGLVLRRITSSVYFDLIKTKGFEEAFGRAFEDYIGLVIAKSCRNPTSWDIHKPEPFLIAKQVHHGADWILADGTANIFIECKATRIRAEAVSAETYDDIEWTTQRLADMVVQNYANISHALGGATTWKRNDLPTFSLVVTLEDFLLFGAAVANPVREKVRDGLRAKNLPEQLLDQVPYVIASASELEGICAVLNEHSAFDVFTKKNSAEHADWLFAAFCLEPPYRDAWLSARELHSNELNAFWHQVNEMSNGQFLARRPAGPDA